MGLMLKILMGTPPVILPGGETKIAEASPADFEVAMWRKLVNSWRLSRTHEE